MEIPEPVDAIERSTDAVRKTKKVGLAMKWNESTRQFKVAVDNDTASPIDILGVQATGGLYIAKVPDKIPANGKAKIQLIVVTGDNTMNDFEVLKVLTSLGERMITIDLEREKVVTLSARELNWTNSDGAAPKDLTVTVTGKKTTLTGGTALGAGNLVDVELVEENKDEATYRVRVTPGDVTKDNEFPVILDLSPRLPGVKTVVRCVVTVSR